MSDDQMNLEIEAEEADEEEVVKNEEPIKAPANKSSSRKSTRRKSTTKESESSGVSKDVKPVAAKTAEPTVEALSLAASQLRVNVRSLWPARLIIREGVPSGEVYEWPNAGALVSVNSEDVGFLMSKNKTGEEGCCGGGPRNYFEIV
jgi:hypothetical protein